MDSVIINPFSRSKIGQTLTDFDNESAVLDPKKAKYM